jgi:uncharacterized protein YcfJ
MNVSARLVYGLLGAALAVGGVVVASQPGLLGRPTHADVLSVRPVIEVVETPRKECRDVVVTRQVEDRRNARTGTIVGALVGGALGNQVGKGSGRDVATVAGAVGGGYIGREIDIRNNPKRTVSETRQQCETVVDRNEETRGYDVEYRHEGVVRVVRLDHDPGNRLPLAMLEQPTQSR